MSQELRQKITHYELELRRLRKQLRKSKGLGPKKKGQGSRDRDETERAARNYQNPGSYVRASDGGEVLKGDDWLQRKMQLAYRSNGACERLSVLGRVHAKGCSGAGEEPHHIIKRSMRRDDRLSNLAALSRACHDAEDVRKVRWGRSFAVKPAPESEQQPI